jgi:hypothetical protein
MHACMDEIAIVSKNNVINPQITLILNMTSRVNVLIAAMQSVDI